MAHFGFAAQTVGSGNCLEASLSIEMLWVSLSFASHMVTAIARFFYQPMEHHAITVDQVSLHQSTFQLKVVAHRPQTIQVHVADRVSHGRRSESTLHLYFRNPEHGKLWWPHTNGLFVVFGPRRMKVE